jgi:hypothetical protein
VLLTQKLAKVVRLGDPPFHHVVNYSEWPISMAFNLQSESWDCMQIANSNWGIRQKQRTDNLLMCHHLQYGSPTGGQHWFMPLLFGFAPDPTGGDLNLGAIAADSTGLVSSHAGGLEFRSGRPRLREGIADRGR